MLQELYFLVVLTQMLQQHNKLILMKMNSPIQRQQVIAVAMKTDTRPSSIAHAVTETIAWMDALNTHNTQLKQKEIVVALQSTHMFAKTLLLQLVLVDQFHQTMAQLVDSLEVDQSAFALAALIQFLTHHPQDQQLADHIEKVYILNFYNTTLLLSFFLC